MTDNLMRVPRRHVKFANADSFYVLFDRDIMDIKAIMPRLIGNTSMLTCLDETLNTFIYCFTETRSENQSVDAIVWK
jgi:hypothetical protein